MLTHWGRDKMDADDILKCIFLNENAWIPIMISLKFVPKDPINNIPALVQIMAWCRPGDKPLSEVMMISLLMHICVTRPQWSEGYPPVDSSHQRPLMLNVDVSCGECSKKSVNKLPICRRNPMGQLSWWISIPLAMWIQRIRERLCGESYLCCRSQICNKNELPAWMIWLTTCGRVKIYSIYTSS